jgi:predicted transcriptional regulator
MKGLRIRPEKRGIRATLFDLEADVMEVVWSKGWDSFAVSEVHRELAKRRAIAYTTVMTTVSRLFDKGLLGRERDGRRYLYHPKLTREAFAQRMAAKVLDRLADARSDGAVALLVDRVARADEAELERIEKLIRMKKKELRRG